LGLGRPVLVRVSGGLLIDRPRLIVVIANRAVRQWWTADPWREALGNFEERSRTACSWATEDARLESCN
jgi:hypothetical protein